MPMLARAPETRLVDLGALHTAFAAHSMDETTIALIAAAPAEKHLL